MNKDTLSHAERIKAALSKSADIDRPPYSFWYHFGLQHLPGPANAEAHIDFYKTYDMDFIKVMNDYAYPIPEGLEVLETAEHWKRLTVLKGNEGELNSQLKVIHDLNKKLKGEVPFVDTVFSPWTIACRLARGLGVETLQGQNPTLLAEGLRTLARSLANYAKRSIDAGASGIFYSVSGASSQWMTAAEYDEWGRPYDLEVLNAVKGAPFNILHIHGRSIHFDTLADYPVAGVNWSSTSTRPTLFEGQKRWPGSVLGGLDEEGIRHLTPPDVHYHVRRTVQLAPDPGLIITPGCELPANTEVRVLKAIGEACRSLAGVKA